MSTLKQKEMQQGIYVGPSDVRPNRDRKDPAPTGAELITRERKRQIEKGFTIEHDSQHSIVEILSAAIAYAMASSRVSKSLDTDDVLASAAGCWPWEPEGFKPTTPIKDLSKAGALIAAAIDLLQSQQ